MQHLDVPSMFAGAETSDFAYRSEFDVKTIWAGRRHYGATVVTSGSKECRWINGGRILISIFFKLWIPNKHQPTLVPTDIINGYQRVSCHVSMEQNRVFRNAMNIICPADLKF